MREPEEKPPSWAASARAKRSDLLTINHIPLGGRTGGRNERRGRSRRRRGNLLSDLFQIKVSSRGFSSPPLSVFTAFPSFCVYVTFPSSDCRTSARCHSAAAAHKHWGTVGVKHTCTTLVATVCKCGLHFLPTYLTQHIASKVNLISLLLKMSQVDKLSFTYAMRILSFCGQQDYFQSFYSSSASTSVHMLPKKVCGRVQIPEKQQQ